MHRKIILLAQLVVTMLCLMFYAGTMAAQQNAAALSASPQIGGESAPDFELKVVAGEGQSLRLSTLRGKGVLLVFWAPWSGPSKAELEFYVELQKQYAASGLQVIAVALDDSSEAVILDFAKRQHVNYPVLLGTGSVIDHYQVEKLPASIFINRDGLIVARESGVAAPARITSHIRKALLPD